MSAQIKSCKCFHWFSFQLGKRNPAIELEVAQNTNFKFIRNEPSSELPMSGQVDDWQG